MLIFVYYLTRYRNTGELCNSPVRQLWDTSDFSDSLNLCTDCHLEIWKIYLQSPFGYDEELAEQFHSATLRCKATLYDDLATPTGYTVISPTASYYKQEFANGCEDWSTVS